MPTTCWQTLTAALCCVITGLPSSIHLMSGHCGSLLRYVTAQVARCDVYFNLNSATKQHVLAGHVRQPDPERCWQASDTHERACMYGGVDESVSMNAQASQEQTCTAARHGQPASPC